jgi:hypothetical protein
MNQNECCGYIPGTQQLGTLTKLIPGIFIHPVGNRISVSLMFGHWVGHWVDNPQQQVHFAYGVIENLIL